MTDPLALVSDRPHPLADLEIHRLLAPEARGRVVLVHGAWHGAWCWLDGFAQRLVDQGVSCTVPSLRGHGASPGGDRLNRLRLRDYVDDLEAVVAAEPDPPVLVGHSMGGGVIQHLLCRASRPPVAGVVLLAALPPGGALWATLRAAWRSPVDFVLANVTLDLGRLVRTPEQARQAFFSEGIDATRLAASTRQLGSESYLAFLDMVVFDRPPVAPPEARPPLLVLGGETDAIFSPSEVHATAAAWGTQAEIVPGMAHNLLSDVGWEQIADRVVDFATATSHD